jgi:hypothetical protein
MSSSLAAQLSSSMITLTPKGRSVSSRVRPISRRISAGSRPLMPRTPKPPAFETAETNSGPAAVPMPADKIGYSMPSWRYERERHAVIVPRGARRNKAGRSTDADETSETSQRRYASRGLPPGVGARTVPLPTANFAAWGGASRARAAIARERVRRRVRGPALQARGSRPVRRRIVAVQLAGMRRRVVRTLGSPTTSHPRLTSVTSPSAGESCHQHSGQTGLPSLRSTGAVG